mgnify:CR=1 FL=1
MSFKNILGQDKPINILKGYIEQSRLAGGYLFVGPEGVGKKLVAQTLAKVVNCQEETLDACDRCASCCKVDKNQHPDVHIIESTDREINPVRSTTQMNTSEKASNGIKIEYIRQLQNDISYKPYEGRKKVFIIDNAHRLTAEAQSALLKILEEPPSDSLIILISDKPALLFKTIISRCKILKFSPLERAKLKEILKKDYSLGNEIAHFLAYFSEGRFGRALKLKDTDILREKNRIIDNFALSGKPASLDNLSIQNKEEVRGYLNILATWFRDIYLIKIGMAHSEIINFDRKDDLLVAMSRLTFLDLNGILDYISD